MSDAVWVALIAAVGLVVQALIARRAVGRVQTSVDAVHRDTAQINHAVNHKATGMPTLVQRVTDQDVASQRLAKELNLFRAWQMEAMQVLAHEMGVALPSEPSDAVTAPPRERVPPRGGDL